MAARPEQQRAAQRGNGSASEGEPLRFHSRAGKALARQAGGGTGLRALDLGPASPRTLAALAGGPLHLEVIDLYRHMPTLPSADSDDRAAAVSGAIGSLLPPREGVAVDWILAWDLLEHLEPDLRAALAAALVARAGYGSRLHLLVHTGAQMPERPMRSGLSADGALLIEELEGSCIPCPRLSPVAVAKILPGFHLEHSTLLSHGIQEVVFRAG